jgi:hypothetical protein
MDDGDTGKGVCRRPFAWSCLASFVSLLCSCEEIGFGVLSHSVYRRMGRRAVCRLCADCLAGVEGWEEMAGV